MAVSSSSHSAVRKGGWKNKTTPPPQGNEPLLTYIRVAERILRVRQSARTALGQMLQAAEDEQQGDQMLVHGIHLSSLFFFLSSSSAQINRTGSDRVWRAGEAAVNVPRALDLNLDQDQDLALDVVG